MSPPGNVYVDTSAILALLDRSDDHQAEVRACVERLAEARARLVTSSYVLVEAGALVKRRLGSGAFRSLGALYERAFEVVWVDASLHRAGWEWAATAGRSGPSLVDCVSLLTMRRLRITTALALDRHFRQPGNTVLP